MVSVALLSAFSFAKNPLVADDLTTDLCGMYLPLAVSILKVIAFPTLLAIPQNIHGLLQRPRGTLHPTVQSTPVPRTEIEAVPLYPGYTLLAIWGFCCLGLVSLLVFG